MTKHTQLNAATVPTTLTSALLGAVVGGAAAAVTGVRRVQKGEATKQELATDVAREAGTTAVATGTAAAVVRMLGFGPFMGTLGFAAIAVGAKYAMDACMASRTCPCAAAESEAKPVPDAAKNAETPEAPRKPAATKSSRGTAKTAAKAAPKATTKAAPKPAAKKAPAKTATSKKVAPKPPATSETE